MPWKPPGSSSEKTIIGRLLSRASGEARISNFLLWQSAYAEYEFIDTLWPDFTREEFARLCAAYGGRDRRYGAVKT